MQALKRTSFATTLACCLLFVALAATPAAAKDTWTKVRTKNFTLVGNASEKDIRQVATRLEQFRDVFSRLFTSARLNSYIPTTVVVFKNFDSYKPFRPGDVAGYFQPGEDVNYITLTAERGVENPYRIIFHEFVHLLVGNNMTTEPPSWFNEGLAEYYSTFEMREGDKQVVLGLPISNHVLNLREQKLIPLQTLFAVDHSSPYYNERDKRGVFYSQSWALVHYFLMGETEARQQQFGRYLDLLSKGISAEESFKQVFASETQAIEKELKKYIGQSSYRARTVTFQQRLEFDSEMQATPMSEAEAQAYLGDLLLHAHQLDRVEPYLQKAVSLDPNLPMAYTSLGLLRVRQGRFADAKQYLERAVGANTQNYLAHFYYAFALIQAQNDTTGMIQGFAPETAANIRAHLRRAIELAPEFPESYDKLAFVNLMTNEQLDESVNLVKRAMTLAPGREHYVLTLAQVQMRRKDFKAARQLLESLINNANADAQLRSGARSILASVEQMEKYEADYKAYRERAAKEGGEPRLRTRDDEAQTDAGGTIETPGGPPSVASLRPAKEGEEQARGMLMRVECLPKGVVFHIKVGERLLRLTAGDLQRIEIVTYTPDVSGEFSCGQRNPPNHVLVTFRPSKDARPKTDGEIVALDFVPKDWK